MKKLIVVVFAAFLYLAFTLPAMAKVTVGGRAALDWIYLNVNDAAASFPFGVPVGSTSTRDDFRDMQFTVPFTLNRLNARYSSDDGAIGAFVEWRGGGLDDSSTTFGMLWYSYFHWQITDNNRITFGKQSTAFARFTPQQWVGTQVGSVVCVPFGNVHHATPRSGIKGYWEMSDMVGLVWGLFDAEVVLPSPGIVPATPVLFPTFGVAPENKLPRIDLALPIRFDWGRIEPSVTWSTATYDQFPPGAEDSYDMYGLSLGAFGTFGMFSLTGEVTWGKNLGGGSYRGAEGAVPIAYLDSNGNIRIADAEVFAYFLDVAFKFGRNKIDLYYASIKYQNDGDPALPQPSDFAQYNRTLYMYGISLAIGVAKGFTIRPEFNFYDLDSSAQVRSTTVDFGQVWLLGLQFELMF
jgi:hypothetical protein